ncbi:MAG: TonB-dependent receptor [Gemmatimonadales bacterium]
MAPLVSGAPVLRAGALLVLLLAARPLAGQARDTVPVVLETLEVTTERIRAVPPPELVVSVPGAVVQKQQAANAYDLVRRAAGLEVHEQGQGPGWASDVVIRGFTSDHSSDVLLVLDGVPINLPLHGHVEGYADWSILSPAAIGGLRVIHGSASPLYGNFAFAGAVEVNTLVDATGSAASLGGSSTGEAAGWFRTGRRGARGGSLVAVDARREGGWRDNSASWLGNVLLRGWRRLGDRTRLEGGLAAYGAGWDSPGFLSVADYNARHLTRAADRTDGGSGGRLVLQGTLLHPLANGTQLDVQGWVQGVRSTVFLSIAEDGVVAQQEERDRRGAVGFTGSWRAPAGPGDLALGLEGRADWDDYQLYGTVRRGRVETRQLNDGQFRQGGAYARWRGFIFGRVQYDLGLRADVLHVRVRDEAIPGDPFHAEVQGALSPKAGARLLLGGPWSAVATVSRGFRSAIGTITDPKQPLVTAWSGELGLQLAAERVTAQLSLFQTNARHERILDPVSLQLSDAGTSRRRGISGSVGVALTPRVRLAVEGTYNDARITGATRDSAGTLVSTGGLAAPPRPSFHDVPLTPGATVPGVARYLGRAEVTVQAAAAVEGRALLRWTGPFTPIGEPGVRTRSYAVTDIGASLRLHGVGTLDVDLQNLFNARYPEIRASGFINPGAPRTLRAALRLPLAPS